jgi:hypothetical protein
MYKSLLCSIAASAITVSSQADLVATMDMFNEDTGITGSMMLAVEGVDWLGQLDDGTYTASVVAEYDYGFGLPVVWAGELSASRSWHDEDGWSWYSLVITMDFGGIDYPYSGGSTSFFLDEITEPFEGDPVYYSYGFPMWDTMSANGEAHLFMGSNLNETIIPAPAGLAVLGLGLFARRRRR